MLIDPKPSFLRQTKKIFKKYPNLRKEFEVLVGKLADNPFDRSLKTHALSGMLKGRYSCSLTDDIRIIFKCDDNTIYLLDIGTHDEVY